MPRIEINYQNTVIYKIVCNDLNVKDVYVGHTTNFTKRKYQHKYKTVYKKGHSYEYKIYKTIRQYGGFENWSMIEIEKYPCNDKLSASKKERYYYELLNANLNTLNPSRDKDEMKIANAKKVICDYCGKSISTCYITRHKANQNHIKKANIKTEHEIEQLELELSAIILKK
jgi:hypothetical protein